MKPIRATHRPVPQPPAKFHCGQKGGTPEQIGLLPPGNRECPVSGSTIMELLTGRVGKSLRANKQTDKLLPVVRHKRSAALFLGAGGFSSFPQKCLYTRGKFGGKVWWKNSTESSRSQ